MKKLSVVSIIVLIIAAGVFIWWQLGNLPVDDSDKSQKLFIITKGEGMREIAMDLKKAGLIRDPITFFILVKEKGYDGKIQAGNFRLSPSMDLTTLAQDLTHGTLDIWITIPEGLRAEEIAEIFQAKLLSFDFTWRKTLDQHEGSLFPDTYLIPRDADINFAIKLLEDNFTNKLTSINKSKQSGASDNDKLIIASLVEREARFADDRPLVASVIYNRLQIGMALQIDSTIQYALGYQPADKTWWKNELTTDDLQINSPYNTYKNTGLPPTPICNPGLSSLEAAYNPAQTQYMYYLSDRSGHLHFAKTLDEHNANRIKYGI